MNALPSELRKLLEKAIVAAREAGESGARKALESLAVHHHEPWPSMTPDDRELRNRLRAHGRQLGDSRDSQKGNQSIDRLVQECAYEHWHRMLFARFLAENGLLLDSASGVAVNLEECAELAREKGQDPWQLAGEFAERMLPEIFRQSDPVLAVVLPRETRVALEKLLGAIPAAVFTADDSLGWTYQFWQSAEKVRVNDRVKAGEKITGATLPAVTQLFTEHYMVLFLLHNTVGAWWVGWQLTGWSEAQHAAYENETAVRNAVALQDYDFEYLRFVRDEATKRWRPAAGSFDTWPKDVKQLRVLDPCCGSGHFLVAVLDLLARLRRVEEGLDVEDAIRAVLTDNLYGLELDARCTQIAAFALALHAWKTVGKVCALPPMHIACCGMAPYATETDWAALADRAAAAAGMPVRKTLFLEEPSLVSAPLRNALSALHQLFSAAPELGALIDPRSLPKSLYSASFADVEPLLAAALKKECPDEALAERAVAAQGMAKAAEILAGRYTLVITNVPYLGRKSHSDELKHWADSEAEDAKSDLAMLFIRRALNWVNASGTIAVVTPQNWLFLTSYKKLRERLLTQRTWNVVVRLGEHAFESAAAAGAFGAMQIISGLEPSTEWEMAGIDVSAPRGQRPIYADEKAALLRGDDPIPLARAAAEHSGEGTFESRDNLTVGEDEGVESDESEPASAASGSIIVTKQAEQLKNPLSAIVLGGNSSGAWLASFATVHYGSKPGQTTRVTRGFWEIDSVNWGSKWVKMESTPANVGGFTGKSELCLSRQAIEAEHISEFGVRGSEAWGRTGLILSKMATLPMSIYCGEFFDDNTYVLLARESNSLSAIYAFLMSNDYRIEVRKRNQKLAIDTEAMINVPFDELKWKKFAGLHFPSGMPEPYSDDPTQWLYHGHPAKANPANILQVGVARAIGYRWPAESEEDLHLAPEARALVNKCREFEEFGDEDGVIPIVPMHAESSAAERSRALLEASFRSVGRPFSSNAVRELLTASGAKSHDLTEWLKDEFFSAHCYLFHDRPFIWHIWDGRDDGFQILVNYHKLAAPGGAGRRLLEKLTNTYLGEWIGRQRAEQREGREGSDARLAAAQTLQNELEKILKGEPPYDIFVRWKPLAEQPIGWDPDINDGVRLNIRPFLMAKDVGKKGAGILRAKPNIKWGKDRGAEPKSIRPKEQFPWFWGCDPEKNTADQTDFKGGKDFNGVRWNDLHYSNSVKRAARGEK